MRSPSIRCTVNVGLAWNEEDLRPQFGNISEFVRPGVLMGSEEQVRDHIGRYVEAGAEQINIAMRAPFDGDALERLARGGADLAERIQLHFRR